MQGIVQSLPKREAQLSITRFDNGVCEMNCRGNNAAILKTLYSAIAYLQKEEQAAQMAINFEEAAA
ncbi:hypothetical protein A203_18700 [Chromobacterium violaceum]|uniref:hypothetical protein n=1 Tax=Chromobacterium violaceum TaxID=536 RepID=UPI003CEA1B18